MCLIVFSFKDKSPFFKQNNSSEKEFVLLANRDEFYDRPTLSMQWWGGKKNILSGNYPTLKDLGIIGTPIKKVLSKYIYRFRTGGQFG